MSGARRSGAHAYRGIKLPRQLNTLREVVELHSRLQGIIEDASIRQYVRNKKGGIARAQKRAEERAQDKDLDIPGVGEEWFKRARVVWPDKGRAGE